MGKNKKFSQETIKSAFREFINGKNLETIAKEYKFQKITFYTWKAKYKELYNAIKNEDLEELEKQNIELIYNSIPKRFKDIREILGLTQCEMANALNSSQKAISFIELGKNQLQVSMLLKLYKLYGANPNYILLGEGHKFFANKPFIKPNK